MADDTVLLSEWFGDRGWQFVLTVAEGKRLIARGVAALPCVQKALEEGIVVVTRGSTNVYVAEELLGREMPRGSFVSGRTIPVSWADREESFFDGAHAEVVLREGEPVEGLTLPEIMREMSAGDVVIKGANALDYPQRMAAVQVQHPDGGTMGTIMGFVHGRGLNLVIPVGLEKQLAQPLEDVLESLGHEFARENEIPRLWPVRGEIVTEIEALELLCGVSVLQMGAGGVCGAEGSCRLVALGSEAELEQVRQLVESIQGEPPFCEW